MKNESVVSISEIKWMKRRSNELYEWINDCLIINEWTGHSIKIKN